MDWQMINTDNFSCWLQKQVLSAGFSISAAYLKTAILICMILLAGCAGHQAPPATIPPPTPSPSAPQSPAAKGRADVSQNLIASGQRQLQAGQIDKAIVTLERAIGFSPRSGPAYFYLAEAWLKKGEKKTARQYHNLAARYLAGNRGWGKRLAQQKRILNEPRYNAR